MKFQDHFINTTTRTMEGVFRSARAMPEDKLNWSPLDEGRTVLDQLQEIAATANFFAIVLEKKADPKFGPEDFEKTRETRKTWDSLDKCEEMCKANTEKLFSQIRNMSDEEFSTKIKFEGSDTEYSLADIAGFHQSHMSYHLGQINYMQTLYGDKDQH